MTQTIIKCNEIPVGKTYPVEHLRTATDLETLCALVDAGHPIANDVYEGSVRLLRLMNDKYYFDYWDSLGFWDNDFIVPEVLLDNIKLAPIAYRNGRPLHVGDEVMVKEKSFFQPTKGIETAYEWQQHLVKKTLLRKIVAGKIEWRFADEAGAGFVNGLRLCITEL